jgi:hypothetical protein
MEVTMTEITKDNFIKIWTDALLSGKYEKGQRRLKRDGKYCCLGVLCELANLQTHKFSDGIEFIGSNGAGSTVNIPRSLAKELHFNEAGIFKRPIEFNGGSYDGLTGLNDESSATFPEIAEIIKREYAAGNFLGYGDYAG